MTNITLQKQYLKTQLDIAKTQLVKLQDVLKPFTTGNEGNQNNRNQYRNNKNRNNRQKFFCTHEVNCTHEIICFWRSREGYISEVIRRRGSSNNRAWKIVQISKINAIDKKLISNLSLNPPETSHNYAIPYTGITWNCKMCDSPFLNKRKINNGPIMVLPDESVINADISTH